VLLVDFDDRPHGSRSSAFYEQMLFGTDGVFPTGGMESMRNRPSPKTTATLAELRKL
jgi:hypothetical protein